jgi:membrane-associated phospholipid phosphatase
VITFWQIEIGIIFLIQSLGSWLVPIMKFVSFLGTEQALMVVIPAIYWCIDSTLGLRLGIMLLISTGLNTSLKVIFHSPRPYWFDTQIKAFSSESSFGMPSGHAQISSSVWGLLAGKFSQTWIRISLVLIIFIIGFSRVYLGVHFISDVLVGWLLGGVSLLIFVRFETHFITWFQQLTFPARILFIFLCSILISLIGIIPIEMQSPGNIPAEWISNSASNPNAQPIDPFSKANAITVAGTFLGMAIGATWLNEKFGKLKMQRNFSTLILRYLVGMLGIAILWFGLASIFPKTEDLLGLGLRYLRYTLVGFWVSAAAPILFIRLHLAEPNIIHGKI